MKHRLARRGWRIVAGSFVALLLLGPMVPAHGADDTGIRVRVTVEPALVVDEGGAAIKNVSKGDELRVVEKTGEAYKVDVDGRRGYIDASLVEEVQAPPAQPASPPADAESIWSSKWTWIGIGTVAAGGGVAAAAGGGGGGGGDGGGGDVSGTWSGTAHSSVPVTLNLSQSGSSVSGNCNWYGRTVGVSGSVSGSSVTLRVEDDIWHLSKSGNSMSGHADKYDGSTYALRLRR